MEFFNRTHFKVFFLLFWMILVFLSGCVGGFNQKVDLEQSNPNFVAGDTLTLKWKYRQQSPIKQFYMINKDLVLTETHRGEIYFLDLATGKQTGRIWKPFRRRIDQIYIDYENAILHLLSNEKQKSIAFDFSRNQIIRTKNEEYILEKKIHSQKMSLSTAFVDSLRKHVSVYSNPIQINGVVFIADSKGTIHAVKNGRLEWKYETGELISHSLMCSGDQLLVPLAKGIIQILDSGTGEKIIQYTMDNPYETGILTHEGALLADRKRNVFLLNSK